MRNRDVTTRMYNVDWGVSVLGFAANINPTDPQQSNTTQITDKIRQKQVSMQSSALFSGLLSHTIPDSRHLKRNDLNKSLSCLLLIDNINL